MIAPQSPKKRNPRLNLRKKSISLDSPDLGFDHVGNNLRQNIPKVAVESYCTGTGGDFNYHNNSSNRPMPASAAYGTWVQIVKSRMAAQMGQNRADRLQQQRRVTPPSSMEFGKTITSAPASYNHCKSSCFMFIYLSKLSFCGVFYFPFILYVARSVVILSLGVKSCLLTYPARQTEYLAR